MWPSGDGSRVYVGLENADALIAIDTMTNKVIATIPIGQAPQAIAYVPNAVPEGDGTKGLQPLGLAGQAVHLSLIHVGSGKSADAELPPTSITLFDQGLVQVLQAAVTGLAPKQPYLLGLAAKPSGNGGIEPLATFTTNPAGSAIVNTTGPIRQIVRGESKIAQRYLVIVPGNAEKYGAPVQIQAK